MFAGHIGTALAIGRADRRVNVGAFIAAALLLDIVLWIFVLLGWESVTIPADFAGTHQPGFDFPYSHGFVAALAWSVVAGTIAWPLLSSLPGARWRASALVGAAVFSHWILDALVHQPELPLAGSTSPRIGLGLWNDMPVALAVEAAIVAIGLYLYVPGSGLARRKAIGLATLVLMLLAFTIAGMTIAPPPPSAFAMAGSSLLTLAVVCVIAWWLGTRKYPENRMES